MPAAALLLRWCLSAILEPCSPQWLTQSGLWLWGEPLQDSGLSQLERTGCFHTNSAVSFRSSQAVLSTQLLPL